MKCTLLIADIPEAALAISSNLVAFVGSSRSAASGVKPPAGVSSAPSPIVITVYLLERHSWLSDMWLYTHLFRRGRGSGGQRGGGIRGGLKYSTQTRHGETRKEQKPQQQQQRTITCKASKVSQVLAPSHQLRSPVHLPRRSRSDHIVVVRQQPLYRRASVKITDLATAPPRPHFPIPLASKNNVAFTGGGGGARKRMGQAPAMCRSAPKRRHLWSLLLILS